MKRAEANALTLALALDVQRATVSFEVAVAWNEHARAAWRATTYATQMTQILARTNPRHAVTILLACLASFTLQTDEQRELVRQVNASLELGYEVDDDLARRMQNYDTFDPLGDVLHLLGYLANARTPDYSAISEAFAHLNQLHRQKHPRRLARVLFTRLIRESHPHPPTLAELTR